jgi:glycoprotein endo-alpha-1,2-mannosidase
MYYPAGGLYSSADPVVLGRQMQEIAAAGIDEVAVSWWGQGSNEDERLPAVIGAARTAGLSVAVEIEPYGGRSVASVVSDVAYLHTLGIATVYLYDPFATDAPGDWQPANALLRGEGVRTFAQTGLVGQAVQGGFSGVYTYDIVTWGAASFARICAEAHAQRLLCAPSVGPGFDATRATGDPVVKPRRDGATYDDMWRAAIAAGADEITITSFNEWQEGTQIEPALSPGANGIVRYGTTYYTSYDGAFGLTGIAAEDAYLARTAYWSAIYRGVGAELRARTR